MIFHRHSPLPIHIVLVHPLGIILFDVRPSSDRFCLAAGTAAIVTLSAARSSGQSEDDE